MKRSKKRRRKRSRIKKYWRINWSSI